MKSQLILHQGSQGQSVRELNFRSKAIGALYT